MRCNAEWYRLLDLCGLTDTLIGDADGIYHPAMLRDQHSLDLVARLYANNSGERRLCLTPPLIEIVGLTPQNISDLINEEVGEIGTV